jgi:hypothetical protein
MTIKLSQLSDNIRISVLDGGMTIYFVEGGDKDFVALKSGDRVIAGSIIAFIWLNGILWFRVDNLWSDSAIASVTLLYTMLEHYKKIISSDDISPAALSVVRRFYQKYKGTEIVLEGVIKGSDEIYDDSLPELSAGYVWSPKLRRIPIQVGKIESEDEKERLKEAVSSGFSVAYSNLKLTKREDPNIYLDKKDMASLYNLLKHWNNDGGSKQRQALDWIYDNIQKLEQYSKNWYINEILNIYKEE